jgi:hypothetical protein
VIPVPLSSEQRTFAADLATQKCKIARVDYTIPSSGRTPEWISSLGFLGEIACRVFLGLDDWRLPLHEGWDGGVDIVEGNIEIQVKTNPYRPPKGLLYFGKTHPLWHPRCELAALVHLPRPDSDTAFMVGWTNRAEWNQWKEDHNWGHGQVEVMPMRHLRTSWPDFFRYLAVQ